ncbi:MAG: lysine 2,3-aminomutase [Nitrospirae bacterium]|nr:MAG: lysine 2,3-aminomutase [Nitrospirota bacterium]
MKFRAYTLRNIHEIPYIDTLSKEELFAIEVTSQVFPFKTNNYVVEKLIDWENAPEDPLFILNFPRKEMLKPEHFNLVASAYRSGDKQRLRSIVKEIRYTLNPHPAGQLEYNVPVFRGKKLMGIQHKYRETVLFFAKRAQTCHAYCSFCFRWPQFIGESELRMGTNDIDILIEYLSEHPEVTDLLFTGGDPMVMRASVFSDYIERIIKADLHNIRNIRIGSRVLTYWPYRFLTDDDADLMLKCFERIVKSGMHLAFMAHFNHPRELETPEVERAIKRIKDTGAEIRTQSPILRNINDDPDLWSEMWERQVQLGCIPYYMFMVRDTGAQHYFGVPIVEAYNIFRDAFRQVSGLARTVRGPVMSTTPGKIHILGVSYVRGEPVINLTMLQGRDPEWVMRPFYAEYDEKAYWLDDLVPAFGKENFFFEDSFGELEYSLFEDLN